MVLAAASLVHEMKLQLSGQTIHHSCLFCSGTRLLTLVFTPCCVLPSSPPPPPKTPAVTKSLSGAARATIDACRTLFIWLYALHAGWESFHALEVVGFVVLISGTSLYNEIIKSCLPGVSCGVGGGTWGLCFSCERGGVPVGDLCICGTGGQDGWAVCLWIAADWVADWEAARGSMPCQWWLGSFVVVYSTVWVTSEAIVGGPVQTTAMPQQQAAPGMLLPYVNLHDLLAL